MDLASLAFALERTESRLNPSCSNQLISIVLRLPGELT